MGPIEEIRVKLELIDKKLAGSSRFRFQKLSRFCDKNDVDPKTIKKFFPEAVYKKGVYWVDLDRMTSDIETSK